MAEGWLHQIGGERFVARSAGIEAHGLDPRAAAVMREAGVDISGQESKVLDPAWLDDVDLLITVCGDAGERCPVLPARCAKQHWPCDDPARAEGDAREVLASFRRVRDQSRTRVQSLVDESSRPGSGTRATG